MITDVLEKELLKSGSDIVGFADLGNYLKKTELSHLGKSISIGVYENLNERTVALLTSLQKKAVTILKKEGHKHFCIPPDSDRIKNKFISKLYPLLTHKIAATSAGIGWIGKNGLLISYGCGPRISLATVLTDAPLRVGTPMEFSLCWDCSLCLDYCPSQAITGEEWSRQDPYVELIRLKKCNSHKKNSKAVTGKPNCGLCITICPYGRKDKNLKLKNSRIVH